MRKVLFWIHLAAGSIAGLVILLMCVTGVLLTYERQMIAWADRDFRSTPPSPQAATLQPEDLLARAKAVEADMPASLTLRADRSAPAAMSFGRDRILYADAYSGTILGYGSTGVRSFFHGVTEWHRWFAAQGESRTTARAITGLANMAFLFLALSGLYLWMPRRWTWQHVKPVVWFRGGLSGKARDFNWHNAIGLWSAIPLVLITISGAVMSYPWANDLVYRLAGTEPPPVAARPASPPPGKPKGDISLAGINAAWVVAAQQVPGIEAITLRLPDSARAPLSFSLEGSHRGRPDLRSTLIIDRSTTQVVKHDTFVSLNAGRRARSWLRFIHTGEPGGVIGQTIAGAASLGGAFLVYTGLALALRRLRTYLSRQKTPDPELVGQVRSPAGLNPRAD